LVCTSSLSSMPVILRFWLLMELPSSCISLPYHGKISVLLFSRWIVSSLDTSHFGIH
jgi:hypothetical protein